MKCSDILPVAVELIGKASAALVEKVGDYVLAEIKIRLISHGDK